MCNAALFSPPPSPMHNRGPICCQILWDLQCLSGHLKASLLCAIPSHHCPLVFFLSDFSRERGCPDPWNIWNALSIFLLRHLLLHGYVYVCFEVITPSCSSALSSDLVSSAKVPLTLQAGLGASPLYSSQSCSLQSTCHIVLCAQSALPMWAPWG